MVEDYIMHVECLSVSENIQNSLRSMYCMIECINHIDSRYTL